MLLYSDQLLLIEALAKQLGVLLADKNKTIVTAESCTGGWVAQAITQVAGSSGWFDRGFITYSDRSKKEQLGVRLRTITKHGAVSREVVEEMVAGAAQKAKADFALAVSGVAGPGGGSDENFDDGTTTTTTGGNGSTGGGSAKPLPVFDQPGVTFDNACFDTVCP